tara:strand:- start:81 stop:248 length:168 start_codon:yes stop_codon:yes gene_type:complete
MKMISPNGKVFINAHPSKVESLLNKGWKEEAAPSKDKIKSSSKEKSKDEVENGNT